MNHMKLLHAIADDLEDDRVDMLEELRSLTSERMSVPEFEDLTAEHFEAIVQNMINVQQCRGEIRATTAAIGKVYEAISRVIALDAQND